MWTIFAGRELPVRELVDAIIEYALKQFFDPQAVIAPGTEASDLSRAIGYPNGEAWGHSLIGMGRYMLFRHPEALGRFQDADRIVGQTDDKRVRSTIETGYATIYLSVGDFEHALEYGIEALRLARSGENFHDEAWFHHGASTLYADLGDLDRALEHAAQGHELFRRLYPESGDNGELAGCC